MLWMVLVFAAFFGGMHWEGFRRDGEARENELAAEQQRLDAKVSQLRTIQHINELRAELLEARRQLAISE